jgi:hypothetical protein
MAGVKIHIKSAATTIGILSLFAGSVWVGFTHPTEFIWGLGAIFIIFVYTAAYTYFKEKSDV